MEFVNRTVIGDKELAALSRGTRKAVRRRRGIVVRIVAGLIIALNLLFAWASWKVGDSRWWVNVAVAVFLLVVTTREDWFHLKFSGRTVQPEAREVVSSFGPEGYTQTSKASDSRFQYDQIQSVCETPEYFLFYLDRHLGQIYAKNGFTKGTAMAFREFISRKTGLPVRNIR